MLRWFHFGEGEYQATEAAIRDELASETAGNDELPPPVEALRPAEVDGALVVPPSEEVFPGGAIDQPWAGEQSGAPMELGYQAAGAFVSADGEGTLEIALDGAAARTVAVDAPGLYELAEHPSHEAHRLALRPSPGVRVWSVSFAPGVAAP